MTYSYPKSLSISVAREAIAIDILMAGRKRTAGQLCCLAAKREVEKHLTGQEMEPWEIIYFKIYKSQLPVIERALETAGLMLGNDKSRGYCLEMICADFLAGASLESGEAVIGPCHPEPGSATSHQAQDPKTNS